MRKTWVLAVLPVALVVGCGTSGSTSVANPTPIASHNPADQIETSRTPSPAPTSSTASTFNLPIGATLRYSPPSYSGDSGAQTFTVMSVKPAPPLTDPITGAPVAAVKGRLVVVEISAEQLAGSGSVNPLYFKVKGSDGTDYSYTDNMPALEALNGQQFPFFGVEQLSAGQKSHGFMLFDIPNTAATVVFSPILGDGGSWTIPAA